MNRRFFFILSLSSGLFVPSVFAAPSVPPVNWLDLYALAPRVETWTMTLKVRDIKRDLPGVLKAFAASGAALTQPLENFPASKIAQSQQLTYRLSRKDAVRALKRLRRLGLILGLHKNEAVASAEDAEIDGKIRALSAEKNAHAAELAKMPAISAVIGDLLDRLMMVQEVRARAEGQVLMDVTVSGRP